MKRKILFATVLFLFMQKAFPQVAEFSIQGSKCVNNQLTFIDESAIIVSSWLWDFGDGQPTSTAQNPTHQYPDSGNYTVSLTITNNNSSYNYSEQIYISPNPLVDFIADSTIIFFSTYSRVFVDRSTSYSPITTYSWNFGDNSGYIESHHDSTLHKFADNGTYEVWLKATDNNGCIDSASNSITVYDRFFVPNVFTPNDDNINDLFIVTSNGSTLFEIEIFSRWGTLIFKREGHQQIIWDGHLPDGGLVKPGTYYYVIKAKNGNVTYDPEKGFITVFH